MTRIRSPPPIAAGLAVAGCLIGGAIALGQSAPYRATTTLVVEVHGVPAAPTAKDAVPTIAALVVSDLVVENVAAAMQLGAGVVRSHLHESVVPRTALVRIGYDDASAVRARQLAQEASSALQAVVGARFGSRLTVAVVDPLSSSRLGRRWFDDALLGALAGALLGLGWQAALTFRPRGVPAPATPPATPEPASGTVVPEPELEAEPEPESEPEPAGRVAELRRALAARRDEFDPDQVVAWEAYLDALEAQAIDGELPPALESLARDVSEPLIEPAR